MNEHAQSKEKVWVNAYDPGVPESIDYEEVLIPGYLERSARNFPGNTALIFEGYKLSFAEVNAMVDTFAGVLRQMGVKKGDSVSILLPNVIPCVVAYYAILRIGAIAVMNNPLYSDRELLHQFNDSGSTLVVTIDLQIGRASCRERV